VRGSGFAPHCSCTGARLAQPTHDGGDAQTPPEALTHSPNISTATPPPRSTIQQGRVPLFRAQPPTWLGLREVRDKEAHSIGEPLGRPLLRNPEEGLKSVRLSTSRRQRPRHGGEVCCEPAADALAPTRRVSAPIFQPNRRPGRGRTAGEISMVSRTGRLEVNGTFMAVDFRTLRRRRRACRGGRR
jgi:hypothetical protein